LTKKGLVSVLVIKPTLTGPAAVGAAEAVVAEGAAGAVVAEGAAGAQAVSISATIVNIIKDFIILLISFSSLFTHVWFILGKINDRPCVNI
jgi:hypothetical protein